MPIKAKVPTGELAKRRLKFFCFAPPNWGKTISCIELAAKVGPFVMVDTERGCELYKNHIAKHGGALLQSSSADEIRDEVKALFNEKHEYRSLIIDPITKVYEDLQLTWTDRFKTDFLRRGKSTNAEMEDFGPIYWQRVKSDHKRLMDLIAMLDMNVFMTAHEKPEYAPGTMLQRIGTTFDAIRDIDYFFDVVFHGAFDGEKRNVTVEKERAEPGRQKFPPKFVWNAEEVIEWWGPSDMTRAAVPVTKATPEMVAEFVRLIDLVKVTDRQQETWKKAAGFSDFSEFPAEKLQKCIQYMRKQVEGGDNAEG